MVAEASSSGGRRGGRGGRRGKRRPDAGAAAGAEEAPPDPPPLPAVPEDDGRCSPTTQEATIPAEAAPYLIGIGGRNVSLIGKHTGAFVHVAGERVTLSRRNGAPAYDPDLARRMALGMAGGAVLKWFSTPSSTALHAPDLLVSGISEQCTAEYGCALRLLRARTGHMCLVLVQLTDVSVANVPAARAAALGRMACAWP